MACQKERGAALIIVLFFCIITAMAAMVILESSALQVKMLNHYRAKIHTDAQVEKRILALESKLKTNTKEVWEEIHFCQFVPDTLLLGEKEGIDYYKIQVEAVVTTFAARHLAEPTLMPAIKLSDGEEGMITTSFFLDKESNLIITDRSGKLIRAFNLLSTNSTPLSEWAVVDSDGNGTADFIYVGNEQGHLWKINVQSHVPQEWQMYLTLLEDIKIKGRILAGLHPQGDGLLLYVWGEQGIDALWDKAPYTNVAPIPYFKIEAPHSDQPLLRQGYLIVPTRQETKIVDAFSGKLVSQEAFVERLGRKTWRTVT